MKYLLYCIFSSQENPAGNTLAGVDEQPVFTVSNNGLSAAVSRIAGSELALDISRILAYKRVLERLHHEHTVIPMRYGSLFDEVWHIPRFLEEHSCRYASILQEVEGCVEMGIRFLISECGLRNWERETGNGKLETENSKPETSGKGYLAARKACYEKEDHFIEDWNRAVDQVRAAFSGLFVKCRTESSAFRIPQSAIRNAMLSLHFLVPKNNVAAFQRVFEDMACNKSLKLLLSGPWPPFNFV